MQPGAALTPWAAVLWIFMISWVFAGDEDCRRSLQIFLQDHSPTPKRLNSTVCCNRQPHPVHLVKCTNSGFISELHLSGQNLNGTIGSRTIGSLLNLTYLDLSGNNFNGAVPSDIWNLSRLQHLDLSRNKFNGSISSAIWNSSNLTYVNLSSNSFDGRIDNVSKTSRSYPLLTLDLSANQIGGSISKMWCSRFKNLSVLNISSNKIENGSFSGCNNLLVLNASFNRLTGEILQDMFNQVHTLTTVDLKNNSLSGKIPSLDGLKNLSILDLSFNNLSGSFDVHFASLPNLTRLNVSHNHLTVTIDNRTWEKFGTAPFSDNNGEVLCSDCSPQASPSPAPSLASHKASSRVGAAAIAGIVVGGVLGLMAVAIATIVCKRRRRMQWVVSKPPFPSHPDKHVPEVGPFSFETDSGTWVADVKDPSGVPVVIFEKPLLNLTFADLLQASSSFDKETEVGDGSGLLYKCVLPGVLPGDSQVCIKVLEEGRILNQDEAVQRFETMGKIKHDNLVPLLGYCIVGQERLLIYKFMERGSLHDLLHALPGGALDTEDWSLDTWEQNEREESDPSAENLCWENRQRIALGIARALAFLHHGCSPQIVHTNISSSCILLDEGLEPHIADCGQAGLSSSEVRGTSGYVPPEYGHGHSWKPTARGDVYSFGVVLLEIATGKRPLGDYFPHDHNCNSLVEWVRCLMKEKRSMRAVDPKLADRGPLNHILETIKIGYLCTAESASKRPTMQQVVGLLKDVASSPPSCSS